MIVLTDNGLAGKDMEHYAADQICVLLVRPTDRKDEKRSCGNLAGMRP